MTWQDEQRRLDEELSAGQLSAEDYQRRHDELMSHHSGGEADTGQGEQGVVPFPPAFRWESAQSDEGNETTQLFIPAGADETQVIDPRLEDADRTQVVHGGPLAQQRGVGSAAPWGPSKLPPMQQPNSAWLAPGPESFESERSSRTPRIAAAGVVAVLLLVLGGFGTYWLWGRDGASPAQQPTAPVQQPAAQEQQPPPAPPAPRAGSDLPAPAEIGGDGQPRVIPTLNELRATGVLTPAEYAAVAGAGATASKLLVSSFEDGPTATMLITRLDSRDKTAATRDELATLQREAGFESAPTPDPGLRSLYVFDDPEVGPIVRGYYRSDDLLVRIEVVGPEPAPTARRYDTIVGQQLATLAADE